MGKVFDRLDPGLSEFLLSQSVFFVATAPLAGSGHVNLSPKGLNALRVLDPRRVAYLDYPGSGAETAAHLRENGRIVIMVCAFDGPPRIVRLHGQGRVIEPEQPEFQQLLPRFEPQMPVRSLIVVELTRVSTSCGFGVPLLRFESERPQLTAWAASKGEQGVAEYVQQKNAESIDGLPAFQGGPTASSD